MEVVRDPLRVVGNSASVATDNGQLTTDKKQKNPEAATASGFYFILQ
jgi:hypothetical protein